MTWKKPLEADARLAVRNATKVRAALRQSVNTTSLVQAYLLTQPHSSGKISQDRARARAWSILNVRIDTTALEAVLQRIWATGYLLGTLAADQAIAAARTDKSATITKRGEVPSDTPGVGLAVDWDNWEPGDEVSALLIKPPRALQRLLQSQGIVIKDMKATSLNVVGNALGDAIALGLAPKRAAKLIQSQVGSPARALTIAITESNRAVSLATMQRYQDAGLEMSKWLTFDPCPLCAMNANVEVRLNEPFPSGDARPPAHPNCRCALAPVIPDPVLSTSGSTTLVKHLPGRHDQQSHAGGRRGGAVPQGIDEVVAAALDRSVTPSKVDISSYLDNPDARTYETDQAKMGEIMKEQGWDKPSLSLSPEEFDEIEKNGPGNYGLSVVYRGGPAGLEEGFISGKHWVGDGNAGPGIYVTNNIDRASSYEMRAEKETGSGELVRMLVPTDMIYKAPDRQSWTGRKNPLPAPINGASRADTLEMAADGVRAYSSVLESVSGDFVIFDPSSIIVRRSK